METSDVWQASERAEQLLALGRPDQALSELTTALAAAPDDPDLLYTEARCHAARGDGRAAVTAAQRTLAADPEHVQAHVLLALLAKPARAVEHGDTAVALAPDFASAQYAAGFARLRRRHRTRARTHAALLLEQEPDSARAHMLMGRVEEADGEKSLAETHYRRALAIDPEDDDAAMRLGWLLNDSGRHEEADWAFRAAGASTPTDSRARHALGRARLPVIGGGVVLALKIGVFVAIHAAAGWVGQPLRLAVAMAGLLVLGATVHMGLRVAGSRDLPAGLRAAQRRDHAGVLVAWGLVGAVACLPIAAWSLSSRPEDGGGPALGAGLLVLAALLAGAAWRRRAALAVFARG